MGCERERESPASIKIFRVYKTHVKWSKYRLQHIKPWWPSSTSQLENVFTILRNKGENTLLSGSCCKCFIQDIFSTCCFAAIWNATKSPLRSYLDHVPVYGCSTQASFLVEPLSDFRLRLLLHFLLLFSRRLCHLVIPPLLCLPPHCIRLISNLSEAFYDHCNPMNSLFSEWCSPSLSICFEFPERSRSCVCTQGSSPSWHWPPAPCSRPLRPLSVLAHNSQGLASDTSDGCYGTNTQVRIMRQFGQKETNNLFVIVVCFICFVWYYFSCLDKI